MSRKIPTMKRDEDSVAVSFTIDGAMFERLEAVANQQGVSVGEAILRLAERGLDKKIASIPRPVAPRSDDLWEKY